jgi:hemerythrin superfamily protein
MTDHSSDRDVIDTLVTDHREATELIEQILGTTDPVSRRDLADSLIAELVRHSVAEEMYVYPAMRDHVPDGDAAVDHDTREHKELERLMKELEGADASAPEFALTVEKIRSALQDHVQDEEQEQFPKLRLHVPETALVELKGKVETAKKIAPTRPHPAAPNAELFHKMAGPGVGLVDRLRDKLTGRST